MVYPLIGLFVFGPFVKIIRERLALFVKSAFYRPLRVL